MPVKEVIVKVPTAAVMQHERAYEAPKAAEPSGGQRSVLGRYSFNYSS